MDVLGLTWLGVRTERFQEMAAMYQEVFGLVPVLEEAGFLVFSLLDGGTIERFGPDYPHNRHFAGAPVAGFLVPDVVAAREEMVRQDRVPPRRPKRRRAICLGALSRAGRERLRDRSP